MWEQHDRREGSPRQAHARILIIVSAARARVYYYCRHFRLYRLPSRRPAK